MKRKFLLVFLIMVFPKLGNAADKSPKVQPLDKGVVERVRTTFAAVLNGDDKKAKLLYGRNYKYMPEAVQFALDLRFKNFEHALAVLPKTGKSSIEVEFWEKVIKSKNQKLGSVVCENIKKDGFPKEALPISHDELAWSSEIDHLASEILEEKKAQATSKKLSRFDEKLSDIQCGATKDAEKKCEPLSSEQQKVLLVESFFDDLHNMQRRDTRFILGGHGSFLKIKTYNRYVEPSNLLKFYHSLKETEISKRDHFLRRMGGIGRDIRPESLTARAIGDEILGDEKDQEVLTLLDHLVDANTLLNYSTGLEYEIASCGLK